VRREKRAGPQRDEKPCGTQKFNPSAIDDGEVGFSVRFDLLQWIRSIGGF